MLEQVRKVIEQEAEAACSMAKNLDKRCEQVLSALRSCAGKVVFMGVGKSGHIGEKLAATFSSTGTPSFFVHATEAVHGDLGMIEKQDAVILISNSGTTKEVLAALKGLKKIGCKTIAFTSGAESALAAECDYALVYPKMKEADHLNLAPTVSSTLTLILGDAVACALSSARGFTREQFYTYHPAGALGEALKAEKTEEK